MLTTHPLLVPRLRKSRSYTSCHPNAPPWRLTGPLYLYHNRHHLHHRCFCCRCFRGASLAEILSMVVFFGTLLLPLTPPPQTFNIQKKKFATVCYKRYLKNNNAYSYAHVLGNLKLHTFSDTSLFGRVIYKECMQ
jgi:hypothetical protein